MSLARYRFDLLDPFGGVIQRDIPYESAEYTLAERAVPSLTLELPPTVPVASLRKDGLIRIYRGVAGGAMRLEGDATWLIRRRQRVLTAQGERRLVVQALHVNHLLARRVVAYAAGSSQASKSAAADNLIKAIVTENFISATDAARNVSGLAVQADAGLGPTVAKAFARRNVLTVLQEVSDAAARQGTYLGWEVRTGASGYEFVTYVGQRGVDRRYGTGAYLPFGPQFGNIGAAELEEDWTDEETYVYALGQGLRANRAVADAQNTAAERASPYGRIEGTINAASEERTTAQLTDEARQELYARRARVRFRGETQDTDGCIYGRDYHWGDLVTVTFDGAQIPCRVDPVTVRLSRDGEQLRVQLQNDDVTV